jgi:hypothetical protein
MLRKELWASAASDARFLCLDCVERRLGRPLVESDFKITPPEMQRGGVMAFERDGPTPPDIRQEELDAWRDYVRETGREPALADEQRAAREVLLEKVRGEPPRLKRLGRRFVVGDVIKLNT